MRERKNELEDLLLQKEENGYAFSGNIPFQVLEKARFFIKKINDFFQKTKLELSDFFDKKEAENKLYCYVFFLFKTGINNLIDESIFFEKEADSGIFDSFDLIEFFHSFSYAIFDLQKCCQALAALKNGKKYNQLLWYIDSFLNESKELFKKIVEEV